MTAKRYRVRKRIIFYNKKDDKSDIKDNMDPDQVNNKYLLPL